MCAGINRWVLALRHFVSKRDNRGYWALLALFFDAVLFALPPAAAAAVSIPEITGFGQYYSLSPEQAAQNLPIRIRGTVLCYDAGWGQFYVNDGTVTSYLKPGKIPLRLSRGQFIELTGQTAFGQGALGWTNLHVSVVGSRPLPMARRLSLPNLVGEYGQWVETTGQVRVAETSRGRLCLVIHDGAVDCQVSIMGPPRTNDYRRLLGSRVRLRGINTSKIVKNHLVSGALVLPGIDELSVLERPASSFLDSPVVAIEAVFDRELGAWTNQPVHINGLIVAYQPGEFIVIKDTTGLIRARISQFTQATLDERVNLWGFLTLLPGEAILSDAFFEPIRMPALGKSPAEFTLNPLQTNALEPLLSIAQVLKLSPDQAARRLPVRVRGVVTWYPIPRGTAAFCRTQRMRFTSP